VNKQIGAAALDDRGFLIIGRIRRSHGVKGEVVVESLSDDESSLFVVGGAVYAGTVDGELSLDEGGAPVELTIKRAVPHKGGWILKFAEVKDRNEADLWRGRYLLAPRSRDPEDASDRVYHHDLLGMVVERVDGRIVGRVVGLYDLPQGVLLEVGLGRFASEKVGGRYASEKVAEQKVESRDNANKETPPTVLLPYHPSMFKSVDVAKRVLVVDPPAGLLDDDDAPAGAS